MKRHGIANRLIGLCIALSLFAGQASALVAAGTALPTLDLEDAWERHLDVAKLRGHPLVLIYEDKDAASQNVGFKQTLATWMSEERFKALRMVPIADVSAYNYFPAKGFARSAVQDTSKKIGRPVYCDWSGGIGKSLGAGTAAASHVVLVSKTGQVLYSHVGALQAADIAKLKAKLGEELGP
jgi:hypothetical protein